MTMGFTNTMKALLKFNKAPDWGYLMSSGGSIHIISADDLEKQFGSMSDIQALAIRQEIRDRLIDVYAKEIFL